MKIKIITVGRVKEQYLKDGILEYSKRMSGFSKIEMIELNDEKIPEKASLSIEEQIKEKEGNKILEKIKIDDHVIALDLSGKMKDSNAFADYIEECMIHGKSSIAFIIGGSLGLSNQVRQRADLLLSFSKFTFPHQLMKLILMEQIYRAFKIMNHETYHK